MRLALICALALALSACATTQRVDAAADVHAFLVSVRDNDRALFDRHVDRRALTGQLEARLREEARSRLPGDLRAGADLLAGLIADAAGEALIRPSTFRLAARAMGYSPSDPIPNSLVIARALKPLDGGRVCAERRSKGDCVFVFERQDGVWRLVAFQGELAELER